MLSNSVHLVDLGRPADSLWPAPVWTEVVGPGQAFLDVQLTMQTEHDDEAAVRQEYWWATSM